MTETPFGTRWLALKTLRTVVRVVGYTPQGEPIVQAGPDRLVLRHGTTTFWPAMTCPVCTAEMARADLGSHMCPEPPVPPSAPLPVPDPAPVERAVVPAPDPAHRPPPAPVEVVEEAAALDADCDDVGTAAPPAWPPVISDEADEADEADETDEPYPTRSEQKRARAVGKRTLGRRVTVIGLTPDGAVVAMAGDIRLLLPPEARHFRWVGPCSFCGNQLTIRLMEPDDLVDGVNQICRSCIRSGLRYADSPRVRPPRPISIGDGPA